MAQQTNKDFARKYVQKAQAFIKEALEIERMKDQLKEREKKLEKAEQDFIQELEDIGFHTLGLTDGTTLSIKETHHCNINKGIADKDNVAWWLRENGAEDLVESILEVGSTDNATKECLDENGISYIEKVEMNTSRVKAFIKEGLGYTGQMQQFEFSDLPKGLHYYIKKVIEVE